MRLSSSDTPSSTDRTEEPRRRLERDEPAVSLDGLLAEIEAAGVGEADEEKEREFSSASLRAGARIRHMRKTAALSQKRLGEILHVSQARISELEAGLGRHGPSWDIMERIAAACDFAIGLESIHEFQLGQTDDQSWQQSLMRDLRPNFDRHAFRIETIDNKVYVTTTRPSSEFSIGDQPNDHSIKVVFEPIGVVETSADVDADFDPVVDRMYSP